MTRGSSLLYYTMDGLGSVTDLTDPSQAVIEQYQYDAFGIMQTPPATGNIYTYTGREYDVETGLYYYRARYYNAQAGRFLTVDPILKPYFDYNFLLKSDIFAIIEVPVFLHPYVYTENNPIIFTDPWGFNKDYCGYGWTEPLVDDYPGGFDFTGPCNKHDRCCACKGDKSKCAAEFYIAMVKVCNRTTDQKKRKKCLAKAAQYSRWTKKTFSKCDKNCNDCNNFKVNR
jgi:RHS repeat-associated protein